MTGRDGEKIEDEVRGGDVEAGRRKRKKMEGTQKRGRHEKTRRQGRENGWEK